MQQQDRALHRAFPWRKSRFLPVSSMNKLGTRGCHSKPAHAIIKQSEDSESFA